MTLINIYLTGIDVAVDYDSIQGDDVEDDSKAWYQEEELHQTEKDLEEMEDKNEHVCHLCKQPFALRAILLQHLVTCRVTSGMTGKRQSHYFDFNCSFFFPFV